MKFQSRSQIEAMAKFKSQGDLVTSFYLDTDKGRLNRKEIQLALKNLLNDAKARATGLAPPKNTHQHRVRGPAAPSSSAPASPAGTTSQWARSRPSTSSRATSPAGSAKAAPRGPKGRRSSVISTPSSRTTSKKRP